MMMARHTSGAIQGHPVPEAVPNGATARIVASARDVTVRTGLRRPIVILSMAWVLAVAAAWILVGIPIATCLSPSPACVSANEQIRALFWWWPWLPFVAGPTAMLLWSFVRARGRRR